MFTVTINLFMLPMPAVLFNTWTGLFDAKFRSGFHLRRTNGSFSNHVHSKTVPATWVSTPPLTGSSTSCHFVGGGCYLHQTVVNRGRKWYRCLLATIWEISDTVFEPLLAVTVLLTRGRLRMLFYKTQLQQTVHNIYSSSSTGLELQSLFFDPKCLGLVHHFIFFDPKSNRLEKTLPLFR